MKVDTLTDVENASSLYFFFSFPLSLNHIEIKERLSSVIKNDKSMIVLYMAAELQCNEREIYIFPYTEPKRQSNKINN